LGKGDKQMRQSSIQTIQDVRQLLKQFGTFIYTKDPIADLDLMEDECRELHEWKILDHQDFMKALLLLKQEKRKYKRVEDV
jgi:uncharacterized protein YqgQ